MTESPPFQGLSSSQASQRLLDSGPNTIAEERRDPLLSLLRKFWAPVPWMLEVAIVLELALRRVDEAIVIAVLLLVNSFLSFYHEQKANNALALLRRRLSVQARVFRDGSWGLIPAAELVPGDVIHVRMGDFVPADVRVLDGQALLDLSSLTGESIPVEATAGTTAYAGAVVKRGESTGEVSATGARTYYGRTAELVRTAKTVSHLQALVLTIVRYLVALDLLLVAAVLAWAWFQGHPLLDMLPFCVVLLVASIPVALPAAFTLTTALGALELTHLGVLVTRLSALEEAAAMDVLASDKTGTLTQNRLAVVNVRAVGAHTQDDVLRWAALACDEATQDPIDLAILDAARARSLLDDRVRRVGFQPFDPQTKRSEAFVEENGQRLRVVKGAPGMIAALVGAASDLGDEVERLAAEGHRVLGVAFGPAHSLSMVGLIALEDPPRKESAAVVSRLRELGIRVLMVTGDGPVTAGAVARQVGVEGSVCRADALSGDIEHDLLACAVFARVLPEDKFRLVQALQRGGHVVGMTGDGVNDAPALKQAEVGIAVENATDVAKAAASIVLTSPGLSALLAAVEASRRVYQRMLTYILNMSIKKFLVAFFLSLSYILTDTFVVTPFLIVLWVISNDFVTLAIATDRVSFSPRPERWRIGAMVLAALVVAALILVSLFGLFFGARALLHLAMPELQTLMFVVLVFTSQGVVYLVRERHHFWDSRPSSWLLASSTLEIAVVCLLASRGILMAPLAPALLLGTAVAVAVYLCAVDILKVRMFKLLSFT